MPASRGSALDGLQSPSFLSHIRYREQQLRANRPPWYLDTPMHQFEVRFRLLAERYKVPVFAHTVLRTPEEQQKAYDAGFSRAKPWESPHQWGLAVDIIHSLKAWDLTPQQWDILGAWGMQVAQDLKIDVVWGGNWDFYDPAHWEIADWKDRPRGPVIS